MTPILYELATAKGQLLSPWCWHARMALAHKNIAADFRPISFTERQNLENADGKTLPFLVEGDTITIDSKSICQRLEDLKPNPTLFPEGVSAYLFYHRYCQVMLQPTIAKMIVADIPSVLADPDRDYFIASREARFGKKLSEVSANRDDMKPALNQQLEPFRQALGNGDYISGNSPAMADYLLFGMLQWARVSSPYELYDKDDSIAVWMESMRDLYDGIGGIRGNYLPA